MGIESEILSLLSQGYTPKQLIGMGYKKSTVYKVYSKLKTHMFLISRPRWTVSGVRFSRSRYMPGDRVHVGFYLENGGGRDFYLYRVGVQAEWMRGQWVAREVREVLKPGQRRYFSLMFDVPEDLELGEYEVRIGVEGQYLPVVSDPYIQTEWSDPVVLHVKHPSRGVRVFISHSTRDLPLVRKVAEYLDNYGIEAVVAEDVSEPGAYLREKIESLIRESTILLAFLTESAVKSKWVLYEIDYAYRVGKPIIPLKEKSVSIESPLEWVEFSRDESPQAVFIKVLEAVERVLERQASSRMRAALALAAMLLLLGWLLRGEGGEG